MRSRAPESDGWLPIQKRHDLTVPLHAVRKFGVNRKYSRTGIYRTSANCGIYPICTGKFVLYYRDRKFYPILSLIKPNFTVFPRWHNVIAPITGRLFLFKFGENSDGYCTICSQSIWGREEIPTRSVSTLQRARE